MHAVPAPYGALLTDFAAGALPPAQTLLVETHLRLRPDGCEVLAALEAAGGALLEGIAPAAMIARPLAAVEALLPEAREEDDRLIEARALIEAAARQPDALSWRWRAPGLREVNLPFAGSSLIRLAGGRALAAHGHSGEEITLVLRGTFSDQAGSYGVGDIGFADAGYDHSPLAPPGEDCVCLVAMTGRLDFHNPVARIVARLLA